MKSLQITLTAVLFLLVTTAAPSFGAEGMKFATISVQQIVAKSKSGSEATKVMEAKRSEIEAKFKGEQDSLKAQADEIEKKSSAWSEEVKTGKERDYQKKMREFQLKVEDAQFELKQLEKKLLEPILKELQAIISEVGKADGLTMVFEKSKSNGLLYAAESLDITDKIIKSLDAKMAK